MRDLNYPTFTPRGLYCGVFHRNGRLFETGNVIGHSTTHLEMGLRMVDRRLSISNWVSVELLRRLGQPFLLSNVVTLLVSVPHKVVVVCIFEE